METGDQVAGSVSLGNPGELITGRADHRAMIGSKSKLVHRPFPQDAPPRASPTIVYFENEIREMG